MSTGMVVRSRTQWAAKRLDDANDAPPSAKCGDFAGFWGRRGDLLGLCQYVGLARQRGAIEALRDFAALLAWAETHAALPALVAQRLAKWASDQRSKSQEALAEAIAMREAIYRLASALANGAAANDCDFAVLSDALALAPARQ